MLKAISVGRYRPDGQTDRRMDTVNLLPGKACLLQLPEGRSGLSPAAEHPEIGIGGGQNGRNALVIGLMIRGHYHITGSRFQMVVQVIVGIADQLPGGRKTFPGYQLGPSIYYTDIKIQAGCQVCHLPAHMAGAADDKGGLKANQAGSSTDTSCSRARRLATAL